MDRADFDTSPRKNPCAQCGHPIAAPDWIEAGPRHASYLWHCRACDYRFEAIAVFSEQESDRQKLRMLAHRLITSDWKLDARADQTGRYCLVLATNFALSPKVPALG